MTKQLSPLTMLNSNDVVDSKAFMTHENASKAPSLVKKKGLPGVARTERTKSDQLNYLKDVGFDVHLSSWRAYERKVCTEKIERFDAFMKDPPSASSQSCISGQYKYHQGGEKLNTEEIQNFA